jgi:hypothetical protein
MSWVVLILKYMPTKKKETSHDKICDGGRRYRGRYPFIVYVRALVQGRIASTHSDLELRGDDFLFA